jgi:predicted RNA polymerase sigma factor
VAALPARQRATLVLRFYCDLNVDQSAAVLGCSPGTVKSQTARALESVRRALNLAEAPAPSGQPAVAEHQSYPDHQSYPGGPGHD